MASGCAVCGIVQFCAGFTISAVSTYLSDAGGGEVNFLNDTSSPSFFVRVVWRYPGFGISVGVFTVVCEVGNTYHVTEVSYPLLVLNCLGLEA